ncbi:MAG: BTAD domain-containing putative transcriptional regulator [Pseudonocardiaceae bacterium]
MAVEFRLLGDIEARIDDRVVDIGHARQRCVLVALLIEANRPVSADQLVEHVWADRLPHRPHSALSAYVSRLRQVLAATDEVRITRQSGGYVLTIDPMAVDLHRFLYLIRQARTADRSQDAAVLFAQALELWRGQAFATLDTPWINTVRDALEVERLAAELDHNDLELRRGHHTELLSNLSTRAAAHPLDERLAGQLMLALYRRGRQADALEYYQELRLRLADELGIDPSPPLQQLYQQILIADQALAIPLTSAATPERVGNLPAEVASFVNRRQEIAEVTRLLSAARLVTLTGVGGVGKTRLALRVAADLRPAFTDGVWVIELARVNDPAMVAHTVVDALGVRDQSPRRPLAVLTEYLRERRMLLLLDNAEHLLDVCAALVDELLRAASGVRILVTSRQPLRVAGEHVLAVAPLSVPDSSLTLSAEAGTQEAGTQEVGTQEAGAQFAAMTLFADRAATTVSGGFAITQGNQAAVAQLCHRLDGIPLAIELAAARLRSLSPAQLLSRLDDRFQLLTTGHRTALPRQQTLRATVDWSFDLCSPQEQRLWMRVSVFAGSFGLEAAEDVCSGEGLAAEDVLDVLDGLVDKSVLIREEHSEVVRYRLLETLRQYGQHKLRAAGEETPPRRRHADWYLRLTEQGEQEWFGPHQMTWFTSLRVEHANLRTAFDFCLTTPGKTQNGLRMAAALCFYWIACGLVREGRHWLDRALTLASEPSRARAKALWVNGWIMITQGDLPEGESTLRECQDLARQLGDEIALAHAMHKLGLTTLFGGNMSHGVTLMEDALARFRALGELNSIVVMAQAQLAMTSSFEGDVDHLVELCREARTICEAHGERWALSATLYALARVEWRRGQLGQATAYARESLRIKQIFNDIVGIVLLVEQLAWIAATSGEEKRAAVLLGAAHRIWPTVGLSLFGSKYHIAAHEECEARARRTLGNLLFETAFRYGTDLTLAQTVAYALDEKQNPATPAAEQEYQNNTLTEARKAS